MPGKANGIWHRQGYIYSRADGIANGIAIVIANGIPNDIAIGIVIDITNEIANIIAFWKANGVPNCIADSIVNVNGHGIEIQYHTIATLIVKAIANGIANALPMAESTA